MNSSKSAASAAKPLPGNFLISAFLALVALGATFLISNTAIAFQAKTLVFAGIALAYFAGAFFVFRYQRGPEALRAVPQPAINDTVEGKLFALEEASEFFGASLKSADMFRLIASRINEILPVAACVLYLTNDETKTIELKYAFGDNPQRFANAEIEINLSLAAKCYLARTAQIDAANACDRRVFPRDLMDRFGSSIAIPLFTATRLFGVLVIYSKADDRFDGSSMTLAEAIGERIAPLFMSSFAFESSVSNALTDTITNLPNERGFYLVLENQIAESQRFRDERPLTVLAIDIRNFDELNSRHGHAVGDSVLDFAAQNIKKQLRQMDVLTRSAGDEFLAVLPTAGETVADEIKERISRSFVVAPFVTSSGDKEFLELNFGAATFWRDGETAPDLLRTARLRKDGDKSAVRGKVLWFPKEYVN